jgi:type I restriction enzyme M protein
MRKSLGAKRREMSDTHIAEVTRLFGEFQEGEQGGITSDSVGVVGQPSRMASSFTKPISRIFKNADFGYRTITVERPLRDEQGKIVLGEKGKLKGKPQSDSSLRDTENVPLSVDVESYFKREVLPHAPDAWIDHDKTKVGYEIPFNRHFYVFQPPRPLAAIDTELKQCTDRILTMIAGLSA